MIQCKYCGKIDEKGTKLFYTDDMCWDCKERMGYTSQEKVLLEKVRAEELKLV